VTSTLPARSRFFVPLRRVPAHLLNGFTVAVGVGLVQLVLALAVSPHAAAFGGGGALCTSLSDTPNTVRRNLVRCALAALLTSVATLGIALVKPHPAWAGLMVALVSFSAMMTMAWGVRAGPVSFAPVLALLFELAAPHSPNVELTPVLWTALGSALYVGWAALSSRWLQHRYRTLALDAALQATSQLLRSRAHVLAAEPATVDSATAMRVWIGDEATLADRLQAARDLLFAAPDTPVARRETAALLHAIELRDTLLASRLDLDLSGRAPSADAQESGDAVGHPLRQQVAANLLRIADLLDAAREARAAGIAICDSTAPTISLTRIEAPANAPATDPRLRLVPALESRMQRLGHDAMRVCELLGGRDEGLPLPRADLQLFVAPERWPLTALRSQFSLHSPVLRHAIRATLAFTCAYYIGRMLPWASHPHWLVLSVAVVLRGNLEQTLARRNARVTGTVLGCLIVLLLTQIHSPALLGVAFLAAVGVAHSFVLVRYFVTAAAASVMALLQAHGVNPAIGFAVGERLADTFLGALLAWGFSYVLPSWERRSLPGAVTRAMKALDEYAMQALDAHQGSGVASRLARLKAYDALGLVAAAVQRSRVEPAHVRLPADDLLRMLDHAYRLMAHLSIVRLTLGRRAGDLDWPRVTGPLEEARAAMRACLALQEQHAPAVPPPEVSAPSTTPQADPTGWLLRRLQLSLHDAVVIHASAAAALGAMRR
jgi:uncharacterized membrane protein YccC